LSACRPGRCRCDWTGRRSGRSHLPRIPQTITGPSVGRRPELSLNEVCHRVRSAQKPGVAFLTTVVVVVVLVAYPLSFGPATWASINGSLSHPTIDACPSICPPAMDYGRARTLATPLRWYLSLWIGP